MPTNALRNRNVTIRGRRTSMKLEPAMWDALDEICRREALAIHELCSRIAERHIGQNVTAATRAFILDYFRAAATDDGHIRAGHGIIASHGAGLAADPANHRLRMGGAVAYRLAPAPRTPE